MTSLNLAIIGHGFVGKAVSYGFTNPDVNQIIIDPLLGTCLKDLDGVFHPGYGKIDVVFVCLPTPMGENGSIDASILTNALKYLIINQISDLIVVKSTVTPDILAEFNGNIIYNPEFLTENRSNEDFVNPIMHVFGGDFEQTKKLEEIYQQYSNCFPCQTFHMTVTDASFVKYGMNSYLATKVAWFNQFYDLVQKSNGNYGKIINAISSDKRIGSSHTTVPGWDGRRGFGGSCFTKDIPALIQFSDKEFSILREAWNVNVDYRNEYDTLLDREVEQKIEIQKI